MSAREHEKSMAGLLRRGLQGVRDASGGDCPGANVLASYYERSLSKAETERCEAHFATCARCQEQLAAMVRSEAPSEKRERAEWFRNWRVAWRWLAPAAAALAVLIVWNALRPSPPGPRESPVQIAENKVASTAPPAVSAVVERAERKKTVPAVPQTKPQPRPIIRSRAVPEGEELQNRAGSRASAPAGRVAGGAVGGLSAGAGRAMSASAESPRIARPAMDLKKLQALSEAGALKEKAEADVSAEAKPAVPTIEPAPPAVASAAQPERAAALQRTESEMKAGVARLQMNPASANAQTMAVLGADAAHKAKAVLRVIASPDPKMFWRVGPGGLIERSSDGEASWQRQKSGVSENLAAGASPATEVCWIVGGAGTVLLTTDGAHWKKLLAPAAADLAGVEAQDSLQASVTATDGRVFSTTDGGHTWQQK